MHITIDVHVKGLEGLANLFNQIKVSSVEQTPVNTGTVVPMPTPAPVPAAPVVMSAAAPQLSVVPASAPVNIAPVSAMPVPPPPEAVPTTIQSYTMEQLAVAATQLMDAGRQPEIVALLASYGVQALTMLPKEHYGNFAIQLRAMGAKI